MRYYVTIAGRTVEVDLTGDRPRVDGRAAEAELVHLPESSLYHLRLDGVGHLLGIRRADGRGAWEVTIDGESLETSVVDERTRAIRALAGMPETQKERTITAPMPGLVVRVEVEVGQKVRSGEGVVIVEAMKMENELKAPADGFVARIEVEAGQTVEKGAVLLVLE